MSKPKFHFYIDVVGTCNLRCPSCPVGNMPNVVNERGVMSPDTLEHILKKATSECAVTNVGLFNWTEPMLHPRLDEMVRVVKKYGLPCAVSTNLNINKPTRYQKLLESGLDVLRVSLSGFSQEKYGFTHKGGLIEDVRSNLAELLRIRDEIKSPIRIAIAFQRYLSNMTEECDIKAFCESHDMVFQPIYALMLPLEKVLAYCGVASVAPLSKDDHEIIVNLALPLREALVSAANAEMSECKLLEQQMTLNWKGDVLQCCAIYNEREYTVGNYMELRLADIQIQRKKSTVCPSCVRYGASNYFLYNIPDIEHLAAENIKNNAMRLFEIS